MRVDLFDFELPEELIALRPARPRDSARLLHVPMSGEFMDGIVREAPSLFREGDLLVFNDTRVIPAALKAIRPSRDPQGPVVRVSLNLIERLAADRWRALGKPGKRLKEGDGLFFDDGLFASIEAKSDEGDLTLRFDRAGAALDEAIAKIGAPPLPPYIAGKRAPDDEDRADYQTIYAAKDGAVAAPTAGLHFTDELLARLDVLGVERTHITLHVGAGTFLPVKADDTEAHVMHSEWREIPARAAEAINRAKDGAVAAPTAGLHFTDELLARLDAMGVERTHITLHVGAGTFLPVKADDTEAHVMHSEWREIPARAAEAINRAKADGRRVIAIGTTALRSLESAADADGAVRTEAGGTDIFITPGYRFRVVDGLWTNFHLPRSTLFMLVSAFAGLERMQAVYAHAIAHGYRFYSYGDASLLWRAE